MTEEALTEKQVNALFERGNNFLRMGNLTEAFKDYDTVVQHRPQFAPAYFNRGIARQHGVKDPQGAIGDYTYALTLKADFPEALINRAIAYTQLEDYESALRDYAATLNLNPNLAQVYVNRGEIYFLRGDYLLAESDFRQAERLKTGYRYAIAGLAVSLFAQGHTAEAGQLWASLVARNPQFQDAMWVQTELGWADDLVRVAAAIIQKPVPVS